MIREIVVGVFSYSRKIAEDKIYELYKKSGEQLVKRTKDYIETESTIYRAYRASENARGSRHHVLYIDKYTDPEVIQTVILPTIRPLVEHDGLEEREGYAFKDNKNNIHYF